MQSKHTLMILVAVGLALSSTPVAGTMSPAIGDQQLGGCVFELEYVTPDGRKLKASLEDSDCAQCGMPGLQSTRDPRWITTASSQRQEWLGYKGGDGKLWFTKVHAEYGGDGRSPKKFKFWFEHRGPGNPPGGKVEKLPEKTPDEVKQKIGYFGWDGKRLLASIGVAVPKERPCFAVTRP